MNPLSRSFEREGIGMTSARTRERLVTRLREQGIRSETVLSIIQKTPRHLFIDEAIAHRAYDNTPLPIGFGQTISQPYIVARMTEALLGGQSHLKSVLEIGTGSGYQTGVLAQISDQVYTIERIKALQKQAKARLKLLGFRNIHYKLSDGAQGWASVGSYDGILVTAAPTELPETLCQQLVEGGRLVIPVGSEGDQMLYCYIRQGDHLIQETLEPVRFVALLPGTEG